MKQQVFSAVGVMSGTSLDGVDVVRIRTDGEDLVEFVGHFYVAYSEGLRADLSRLAQGDVALNEVLRIERRLSEVYARACLESGLLDGAEVVGCHGQTIRHLPSEGLTWQLGDANWLAERLAEAGFKVPVVMDFRRRDMAAGGQGAPLIPLYHALFLRGSQKGFEGAGLVNVGGVANVTWVAADGALQAADCGPGVGLIDVWVKRHTGQAFDDNGALGLAGVADMARVEKMVEMVEFWRRPLPRSADRYEFVGFLDLLRGLNVEDGVATLVAMTARGIGMTLREFGVKNGIVGLVGGGAKNAAIVKAVRAEGLKVVGAEEFGVRPLTMEAEGFAWLAVRRLRGLVLSLPETTGASRATVGGVVTA